MDYQHTREESSWKIETHAYQRIMVIIKWQLDKFQKVKKKILDEKKKKCCATSQNGGGACDGQVRMTTWETVSRRWPSAAGS